MKLIEQNILFDKVMHLCNTGRLKEAKAILLQLMDAKTDIVDAYRFLAQIYMMEGNNSLAKDTLLDALVKEPNNHYALMLMGNLMMRDGKYEKALDLYNQSLESDDQDTIVLNNIAAIYTKLNRQQDAKETFGRVIAVDPTYLNAYYGKAGILHHEGKIQEAFNILVEGLRQYVERPENPEIYPAVMKDIVRLANCISDKSNFYRILADKQKEIEKKWHTKIVIEEDESIKTAAKLEYGPTCGLSFHRVVYNPNAKHFEHLVMHEFMHLEMNLEAGAEVNRICFSTMEQTANFRKKYLPQIRMVLKKANQQQLQEVTDNLGSGLCLQAINCPLDLFVEDRLFEEHPEMRPIQLLSLLNLEEQNIKSSNNADIKVIPHDIVSANRIMNYCSSIHLKKLFGVNMLADYHISKNEKEQGKILYDIYEEYVPDHKAGEEYDMLLDFTDQLDLTQYITLESEKDFAQRIEHVSKNSTPKPMTDGMSDEELYLMRYEGLTEEETERQRNFDRQQREANPKRDLMMAMYMECALEEFDKMSPRQINIIAMEIAVRGMKGISPSDNSGYSISSFPGRDFSGYEFLAYYYVSWKIAHPEDIKAIGLQVYDLAYIAAKKRFDQKKNK